MSSVAHLNVSPLYSDRETVEKFLTSLLHAPGAPTSPFGEAMRYAVLGQGQRIRPILTLRIARLLGVENILTLRSASAVEILHCASLVVDDLPCMDNESLRRGSPCTHVAYGEATAVLASFGLVALAARLPVETPCPPAQLSNLIRFQTELLRMLDVSGLCEGQDLDLRVAGHDREALRSRVIELKTVPLFELAAAAGLLFTDPDSHTARVIRRFSRLFGMAFQIADDYLDGEIPSISTVEHHIAAARESLKPLAPAAHELEELLDYLHARCLTSTNR
jgi:geranylgeranyl pyrophosphate synthase